MSGGLKLSIKFSIITVCYNSENTIRKTFESILDQDYDNYEYIVIDGGSKDSTLEIIKEYEAKFNGRMKWISEPDKGIYDAMNKGIKASTGELLGFINTDDFYEKGVLRRTAECYKDNNEPQYLYGDTRLIYEFDSEKIEKVKYAPDRITKDILQTGMGFIHQSSFINRKLVEIVGYYNVHFKVGADWDYTLRAFNKGIKFVKLNIIISTFSKDGVSARSHVLERHKIRNSNGLYNVLDIYLIKDFVNPANLIQYFGGYETFLKARKFYHNYIKK